MDYKSIKLRKDLADRLDLIDKSPNKAIKKLLNPDMETDTRAIALEKEIKALKQKVSRIEDFIFDKSGGMF